MLKCSASPWGVTDGKSEKLGFETGIENLIQDKASGTLYFGTAESQPVLLVRLQSPAQ